MLQECTASFCIGLLVVLGAVALPVEEEPLTFEVNGIQHYETRKVSDNIVTLTDVGDQFIVTLDYGRNIALINNLKTQACYFIGLEEFPLNEDDNIPVLVVEGKGESNQNGLQVLVTPVGTIPYNYVHLTNDINVAEQCVSKPSYWLEMKGGSRKRRGYSCDGSCSLLICIDVDVDVDIDLGLDDWKWPWG